MKDKLMHFFDMCDRDGNGALDRNELTSFLRSSLRDKMSENHIRYCVESIFSVVDENRDGDITRAELLLAAEKSDYIKSVVTDIVSTYKQRSFNVGTSSDF